jgi:hypothetical protein
MRQAHKFKLKINDVSKEYINLAPTDQFLATAYLRTEMPAVELLMEIDSLYLITAVLTATSMTLESETGMSFRRRFRPTRWAAVFPGRSNVFKAEKPVAFAFQAAKLVYEDGNYVCLHPERSELTLMSNEIGLREDWLCDEIGFDIVRMT